jgi:NTP pyrophosphatase (non-canonical NTP hydrolase)
MKNIAIIYHDADFDGKLSNEVCRFHLKHLHPEASIHSYGWDYGRPVPLPILRGRIPTSGDELSRLPVWEDYDLIYIVDLSVDELMSRVDLRDKIVWIDHHKSAIEKWDKAVPFDGEHHPDNPVGTRPQFAGYRIDGVAACRLCWQWFTRRNRVGVTYTRPVSKKDFIDRVVEEPELIRLAGEYDIWDLRDPNAKPLQFGLRACSGREFREVVEWQFDGRPEGSHLLYNIISEGQMIKSYCDKQADEYSAEFSHNIKKPMTQEEINLFTIAFNRITQEAHTVNVKNGWWEKRIQTLQILKNQGIDNTPHLAIELLGLTTTEISEAIEAIRKHSPTTWPDPNTPDTLVRELAGTIIRIMDLAAHLKLPLADAITKEITHNTTRGHRHGGKAA